LEYGIGVRGQDTRMMGLPEGQKLLSYTAVQTQFGRVKDSKTDILRQQRPPDADRRAGMVWYGMVY